MEAQQWFYDICARMAWDIMGVRMMQGETMHTDDDIAMTVLWGKKCLWLVSALTAMGFEGVNCCGTM
jgi:hypothetical protein